MKAFLQETLNWRWLAAALIVICGFTALSAGVSLTERPSAASADALTKAYYVMGLFVVGGLDIGTPVGGPTWARTLLWFAFFGAPMLTASAVLEAVLKVLRPMRWQMRNLRGHIVVLGSGPTTFSYLRMLKRISPKRRVVVVDKEMEPARAQELDNIPGVRTLVGDLSQDYILKILRLRKASRVVLLGNNDFQSFEVASRVLDIAPRLANRLIIRCNDLRFMRALADTALAQQCEVFNAYNLAAQGFVRDHLMQHFEATAPKDTVLIAGLGRFGQSVMEELEANAREQIREMVVIDLDADRRFMVVEEQEQLRQDFKAHVFQGDIAHPEVWRKVTATIDLSIDEPTVILGTGREKDNIRTALWIKRGYPNAKVFARTTDISQFANSVGDEYGVQTMSIAQLVELNIPDRWLT